jgi:hypothetical protein
MPSRIITVLCVSAAMRISRLCFAVAGPIRAVPMLRIPLFRLSIALTRDSVQSSAMTAARND